MKITHVAVKSGDTVYSLVAPNRHHDALRMMAHQVMERDYGSEVQGFVDEAGNFLNRREAYDLAVSTGQIDRSRHPPNCYNGNELYSEDLW